MATNYTEGDIGLDDLDRTEATLRYRLNSNFSLVQFNGINRAESAVKAEWDD